MKTNRTVSAATLARTAVLALALINQLLSACLLYTSRCV